MYISPSFLALYSRLYEGLSCHDRFKPSYPYAVHGESNLERNHCVCMRPRVMHYFIETETGIFIAMLVGGLSSQVKWNNEKAARIISFLAGCMCP